MRTFSKHTPLEYAVLYGRFLSLYMRSKMQYKMDTLLTSAAVLIRECVTVVTLYLMLQKFSVINGWDLGQLLFMYSFVFLSYSLCILVFAGVRDFQGIVHQGEFDSYLTKPLNPLFQVISRRSDLMAMLGHGGLGLILFLYAFREAGVEATGMNVLKVVLVLIGGILIQGALLLVPASLTFWLTKSSQVQEVMFYQMRGFIAYPISIYPKIIQWLLTYLLPFAFVNYYPAHYFVGVGSGGDGLAYLTPVVGLVLFGLALLLWRTGINRYKSTGN
ncbi:ABC transporter permease [Paenibacillus kobensis]|uniref:ABC transporter permease n=1 Tax=Paenibacillus kobensis TaxID=59841 RepID=UPI000FD96BE7|nr:ABC-2 family transporter protein [Paenibacillus kobensis]